MPCTVIELFLSFHIILPIILWSSEIQSNQSVLGMPGLFDAKVYAVEASQIAMELKSLTSKPLSGDCSLGTARVPDP